MHFSIISLKIVCLFAIWFVSILFGALPYLFKPKRDSDQTKFRILGLGNALAGGVFLGGGLCHLLSDSIQAWNTISVNKIIDSLPVAQILTFVGFMFVFLLEKVVFSEKVNHHEVELNNEETSHKNGLSEKSLLLPLNQKSSLVPILITLMLSIHSLIAGITIGIQDKPQEVISLFIAVISHKWTESFALGVTLVKSNVHSVLQVSKYLLIYSFMAPFGILFGLLLSIFISAAIQKYVNAIFAGIAAGTFIYIGLVDILIHEFSNPQDKWIKYFLTLFGFALITSTIILFNE